MYVICLINYRKLQKITRDIRSVTKDKLNPIISSTLVLSAISNFI